MNKRNLTPYFLISSVCLSFAAFMSASVAWFHNTQEISLSTKGYTESSYFAGGDGSQDNPYIITNKVHMYNLAWLQYLGEFNKDEDQDGKYDQTYFRIGLEDGTPIEVDMSGLALPPIGTEEYPFVGHFDGNGSTIQNLITTNKIDDDNITTKPLKVSSLSDVKIVGLFGVVGSINGTQSSKYDSSILEISDFYLEDCTVRSYSSETLIGSVAGYVNGSINGVGVVNPTIQIPDGSSSYSSFGKTNNLSDYSLIGFAEEEYVDSLDKVETTISNPTTSSESYVVKDEGNQQGWGGSIDMLTMYNNLKVDWNQIVNTNGGTGGIQYPNAKTINQDIDGNVTSESITGYSENGISSSGSLATNYTYTASTSGNWIRFYDISKRDSDGKKTSSVCLLIENPTGVGSSEWQYMCLSGYANRYISNGMTTTTNGYFSYAGKYISSTEGGTTNYLKFDAANGLMNTTDISQATVWIMENGDIYTTTSNQTSSTYYYLRSSNTGALSTSNSSYGNWSVNENTGLVTDANSRALTFDSGSWKTIQVDNVGGFYLSYSGYYVNFDGTSLSASTTAGSIWFLDSSNNIYTTYNNRNYYLGLSSTRNNQYKNSLVCSTNPSNKFTYSNNRFQIGTNYYALSRSSATWTVATRSTTATSVAAPTITDLTPDVSVNLTAGTLYHFGSRQDTENSPWTTPDTYFPLSSENGVPTERNTGYVVSGANYFNDAYGDIRVSGFKISDSLTSAGGSSLTTVRTINASGDHSITTTEADSFAKYNDSLTKMRSILSESSSSGNIDGTKGYVYGLHFMNAQISLSSNSHETRVEKAVINGNTYYDYQLPQDCIDFNLKEKGYINFFAGTYYTSNKSFFALYDIFRNESSPENITGIKEITSIYSDGDQSHSYVYKYSDNTYSVPFKYSTVSGRKVKVKLDDSAYSQNNRTTGSLQSGYSLVFNCSWIKAQSSLTEKAAYYFEIPSNDGEYCLGSVSGSNGAYLMYLDLAANALKMTRTTIKETIVVVTSNYIYPIGVALVKTKNDDVDSSDSAFVAIGTSFSNSLNMSFVGDDVVVSGGSGLSVAYRPSSLSVVDSTSNSFNETPKDLKITEIDRICYVDVNSSTKTATYFYAYKIISTASDGAITTTYKYEALDKDGAELEDFTLFAITDGSGSSIELDDATISGLDYASIPSADNTILKYSFECSSIDDYTISYHILLSDIDEDDLTVGVLGYEVIAEALEEGAETITVIVNTRDNSMTFIFSGMNEA